MGKKTAIEFAKQRPKVVTNYNSNTAEAESAVEKITLSAGKAIAIQADASQNEDVQRLFKKRIQHFGKVDIVVNNAGIG